MNSKNMKSLTLLLVIIAAFIGSVINLEQRYYGNCRRYRDPRRCRWAGCNWNWRFRRCLSWWDYNNEGRGDGRKKIDAKECSNYRKLGRFPIQS